jgi:alanyl-tRNA synthetase
MELCGGTHAESTGSIGIVRLVQERGIAAGTRRVEALTGALALHDARDDRRALRDLQSTLNVDRQAAPGTVARLLEQNKTLAREVERLRVELAAGGGSAPAGEEVREVAGVRLLVPRVQTGLDKSAVRALVDKNRERLPSGVIVQWALQEDRANVTTSVSRDLIPPLNAGEIVKVLARLVDGKGGGRADMAEAGGRKVDDLNQVRVRSLEIVEGLIREARAGR